MARFVTEEPETERLLGALTAQNAFASRLPDGVTYRFHHMMKACAAQVFRTLPGAPAAGLQGALWALVRRARAVCSTPWIPSGAAATMLPCWTL